MAVTLPAPDRRAVERRLAVFAAIFFPLVVLLGFARTYYLKLFFDTPPLASALVHLHGITMTAWVLLFVAQVYLVSSRRVRLHQRLGLWSIVLAVIVFVTGMMTAITAARFGPGVPPPLPPLNFLIVPFTDMLLFALLFGLAIHYRRRPEAHRRLMFLTAVNFLPPALARIPIESVQAVGPLFFFGLPAAVMVAALAYDTIKTGRLNKFLAAGSALLVASYPLRLILSGTDAWVGVARWLTSLV